MKKEWKTVVMDSGYIPFVVDGGNSGYFIAKRYLLTEEEVDEIKKFIVLTDKIVKIVKAAPSLTKSEYEKRNNNNET